MGQGRVSASWGGHGKLTHTGRLKTTDVCCVSYGRPKSKVKVLAGCVPSRAVREKSPRASAPASGGCQLSSACGYTAPVSAPS